MCMLLVIIPLLGVLLLNLPGLGGARHKAAFWFAVVWCLCQGGLILGAPRGFNLTGPDWMIGLLSAAPVVDNLALVMFLAISIVGFAALMVARFSIADHGQLLNFTNLLILALAGMNGMVLAHDLFSLYVFLEVTAVSSFVLIVLERGRDAFEGAFKYIVLSAVATVLILSAIALLIIVKGGVSFTAAVSLAQHRPNSGLTLVAAALLLTGLFIKSGQVPFHGWVPDAYSAAPSATSVLLAGIVTKTTGVYAMIRVVTVLFPEDNVVHTLLLIVGALSVVVGALAALGQKDFKRMLAYSSISQVGYIILGVGVVSAARPDIAALGLAGAILHLFNHSVFKSLLFVNAAAVERQTGTRDMDRLGGLAERMPLTGLTSAIAFLSTAGIPPLSGFWSKLFIIVALWSSGNRAYATIAILASVLTLAYFLVLQRKVFFGKLAEGLEGLREANSWNTVPCCLLAGITIFLGIGTPWLFQTFLLPIRSIL